MPIVKLECSLECSLKLLRKEVTSSYNSLAQQDHIPHVPSLLPSLSPLCMGRCTLTMLGEVVIPGGCYVNNVGGHVFSLPPQSILELSTNHIPCTHVSPSSFNRCKGLKVHQPLLEILAKTKNVQAFLLAPLSPPSSVTIPPLPTDVALH